MSNAPEKDILLDVRHLKKYFHTDAGMLHAVDDVSFTIERGKTLGIVGESGCGKSTIGRTILRLIEPTSGEVFFDGKDILKLSKREMRRLRQDMQIIFQDPYSSLDPRMTISHDRRTADPSRHRERPETKGTKSSRTDGDGWSG